MSTPLIQCIPNFSEARRTDVIEAIIASIRTVSGGHILDYHSDPDHNRTVITYIGSPEFVEEASFNAIKTAAELINLDHHTGEHPRIGATDVVPFVPVRDVSMLDCVELSRKLGKRVASELNIPIYLYEESASKEDRISVDEIRKGQYEKLREEILTNPDRSPDYGPNRLGPAGATIIGARYPLIALNAYLSTSNVGIARKIAKAIRFQNGGLRNLNAFGTLVEGQAQITMNLSNFRSTPLNRAVELLRKEAARFGVMLTHCELVGMIPQDALNDAARWYLQLDNFNPNHILERRLMEAWAKAGDMSVESDLPSFSDLVADANPIPSGSATAIHTSILGISLIAKIARISIGKHKFSNDNQAIWTILDKAEQTRKDLKQYLLEDNHISEQIIQAHKLPNTTDAEIRTREKSIETAKTQAAVNLNNAIERCHSVLSEIEALISFCTPNLKLDLSTAFTYLRSATGIMVDYFHHYVEDYQESTQIKEFLKKLEEYNQTYSRIENLVKNMLSTNVRV